MNISDNTFKSIYIIVFVFLFIALKNSIFFSGYEKMLASAVLGAVGALSGYGLYILVHRGSTELKYITLIVSFFFMLVITFTKKNTVSENEIEEQIITQLVAATRPQMDSLDSVTKVKINEILHSPVDTNFFSSKNLTSAQRRKFITCEICGYKGVLLDSSRCYYCYSDIFDTVLYKPAEKAQWIKKEQLSFFSIDTITDKIEFYAPKVDDGFKKDPLWKPSVTEPEVRKYSLGQ